MSNQNAYYVVTKFDTKAQAEAFQQMISEPSSDIVTERHHKLDYVVGIVQHIMTQHLQLNEAQIQRVNLDDVLDKILHLESRELIHDISHIICEQLHQTEGVTGVLVHLTNADGVKKTVPYGDTERCASCGRTTHDAPKIITGGDVCAGEWACSDHCYEEMRTKGCAFDELGDMTYRPQRY